MDRITYRNTGHVYVLIFKNGIVKVGRTQKPEQRIATHAASLGVVSRIVKKWVSPRHVGWKSNEAALIEAMGGVELGPADGDKILKFASELAFPEHEPVTQEMIDADIADSKAKTKALFDSISSMEAYDEVGGKMVKRTTPLTMNVPDYLAERMAFDLSAFVAVNDFVQWSSDVLDEGDAESAWDAMDLSLGKFLELRHAMQVEFSRLYGVDPALVDEELTRRKRERLAEDVKNIVDDEPELVAPRDAAE